MLRKFWGILTLAMLAVSPALAAGLSAAQIVDKNVAARGGLPAWRAVKTLSLEGKMGAGGNRRAALALSSPDSKDFSNTMPKRPVEETQLPFLMEMMRPRKVRVEIQFKGQTAVQVYDGSKGWKVRPFLNRTEVEPFTAEELKKSSYQEDLDGPLMDYVAKGSQIELDGNEKVNGRDTYKLKLTEKGGYAFHVWVDAQTFLEAKIEGRPRHLDGVDHPVEVYYSDYRAVDGLQVPFVMETRVLSVAKNALGFKDTPVPPERIVVEKAVINPKLEDKLFSKAGVVVAAVAKSK